MQPNPKAETADNSLNANGRPERRKRNIPAATDRRKHDTPEGDSHAANPVEDEATSFKKAMDRYKRENRRPFPTWSEVLEVLRSLGYRKVADETELPGTKKETAGPPPAKG
jgi:hypothetical protein